MACRDRRVVLETEREGARGRGGPWNVARIPTKRIRRDRRSRTSPAISLTIAPLSSLIEIETPSYRPNATSGQEAIVGACRRPRGQLFPQYVDTR
jgi:hypothetical protein